jgi:hypothetical protein
MRRLAFALVPVLAGALGAAVPAAAQPQYAAVPPGAPPVGIDDCVLTTNVVYPGYRAINGNFRWVTTAGLKISFHNRSAQRAQAVRFEVDYRGDVETIDDVGSFAPGVAIVHNYAQFVDFAYLGTRPNYCHVVQVKLADGTVWASQRGRQQMQPQSQSPSH